MLRVALLAVCIALSGCASVNDALTPSAREGRDDFYGAATLTQPPVSAARGLTDGWNTLGFDWSAKTPDLVYVTVGSHGVRAITEASFNIDGRLVEQLPAASALTEYEAGWARRRFAMRWEDFEAMAQAQVVRLRVGRLNDAVVSTFGTSVPDAAVMAKLPAFVDRVRQLRAPR